MSTLRSEEIGKAFPAFALARLNPYYQRHVILVGSGYGAFLFRGTAEAAEEMRVHKARWEGAVARLRPASLEETEDTVSQCWNHPLFRNRGIYVDCQCGCQR